MAQITEIITNPKNPSRASIRVEGKTVATLPRVLISQLGIEVGATWTQSYADEIVDVVAYDKAMRAAMNRLNRRMMSRKQLADKLKELEHAPNIIEKVCARLLEVQVLDDTAYGRALIRQTMARKPAGPKLLYVKLMQKGLDRQLITQLVEEACQGEDHHQTQCDAAVKLIKSKLKSMRKLEAHVRKRRLWGALARRGFESQTIQDAMQQMQRELNSSDDASHGDDEDSSHDGYQGGDDY